MSQFKHIYAIFIALIFVNLLSACSPAQEKKFQLTGTTMGTSYHITFKAMSDAVEVEHIQVKVDKALLGVNEIASTYMEDSELSLFNAKKSTLPIAASDEFREMLSEAIRLESFSNGYLDVTVGSLVNLWGFGPANRPETTPTDEMIAQARDKFGIRFLSIEGTTVRKANPDVYLDLSTLAKGYGVDVVADLLDSKGIHDYLVEIGGEIRTKGTSLENKNWVIAVENPVSGTRAIQRVITPKDNAIATAGDYRNFYEENNVRYSHLIDPKTGRPITHRMVSTSVISPSCMVADGLSTAFMIMGLDKAMNLANEHNIAALFITKNLDGTFSEHHSEAFTPYLKSQS
ncbi:MULTISPECIES: FAD:protein FMN transferase [unclassified Pseudoalteromonas]|uniref:FAD:protein FMN transferase n=2 Tax=Pseudoalteromonas TaxID=53246 RepID=UPI0020C010AA|nr:MULTISPECIES: FAD:protein FMN transferase [unclassified Pseudoalteromonas]MCK8103020.1 FAD:protein FMN transferase [Pseudoalteromonas sp. 2CM36K]MDN3380722.1 FAD:protein FMN transferase [Pseudoalteromonas sp. APC 3893]MDN3389108.1 FAD:protein FMN transferase [Pseudoalteromonas sp. APC 4017]